MDQQNNNTSQQQTSLSQSTTGQLFYIVPQNQANSQQNPAAQSDDIDIMAYVKTIASRWKFLAKVAGISILVGLIIALSLPKHYSSTAVLAPEVTQKSSGGGLSSLAALAGVNLSAGSNSDAMYPDLYPQIIGSAPFIVDLFSMPISVERGGELIKTDLYTYLNEYGKSPWWSVVINAPFKAIGWVIDQIKGDKVDVGLSNIEATHLTQEQNKIYLQLCKLINASVDKKTFIITIDVQMGDAEIAKVVCDEVVNRLKSTVVDYRTEKARHDLEYYKKLEDEAKAGYYEIQQKYASYVDANQGVIRQSTMLEQQRLQNETNLAFNLYNQTAQQRQMAEAKLQEETPVCLIVQPASVPLRGEPSRAKVLIMIVFLAVVGACAWVIWGDMCIKMVKDVLNSNL